MHKARHTAGQRLLDGTRGNLKAVQKLLGHKSMQTTGDIYTDWDLDQLADVLRALETDEGIVPASRTETPCKGDFHGGGGNRTRVRGRTGKSVYKRVLRFAFARRPVHRRPTDGLAILWSPASGDWLSLGGKPVC